MSIHNVYQTMQLVGYEPVAQFIPTQAVLDQIRLRKKTPFFYTGDFTQEMMSTLFSFGGTELTFTFLKNGTFGSVFSAVARDSSRKVPPFVVKIQNSTEHAKRGLESAEKLRDCGIVSFKTFELEFTSADAIGQQSRHGFCLATFMDRCEGDCLELVLTNDADRSAFAYFVRTLIGCLQAHKLTYTDMKPDNIGYMKLGNSYRFRLLDLDGTNNKVSTYPAIANWATTFEPRDEYSEYVQKMAQTKFASAITEMMVCGDLAYRKMVHNLFYHDVFDPYVSTDHAPSKKQLEFLKSRHGQGHERPEVQEAAGRARAILRQALDLQRKFGWGTMYS